MGDERDLIQTEFQLDIQREIMTGDWKGAWKAKLG